MLYEIQGHFVDVVRELPYEDLLTIRSSSTESLAPFKDMTVSQIVQVPHHIYTHIIHVPAASLESKLKWTDLRLVEKLERLTPEPVAFGYEFAYYNDEGHAWGDYGFCWPGDIESTKIDIYSSDRQLIGDVSFMPLFSIPNELVDAPINYNFDGEIGFE